MQNFKENVCPRCGNQKLKGWNELTEDEKILVEKLSLSAELRIDARRGNRWCARCWYEFDSSGETAA
ncbi:MAG: hypothetical protein M3209_13505 [Acidobacteriota bacterium]|nr:hypothetical protein [Acidobacteriota bacterium]